MKKSCKLFVKLDSTTSRFNLRAGGPFQESEIRQLGDDSVMLTCSVLTANETDNCL